MHGHMNIKNISSCADSVYLTFGEYNPKALRCQRVYSCWLTSSRSHLFFRLSWYFP